MTRNLINEARRHQRRRRQAIGAILVTPLAISGLIVGLNLGDTGRQAGKVATQSGPRPSKWHAPQAVRAPPTTSSPSNVVVLNPGTGDVVAAEKSAASAAAATAAAAQSGHH
jgi:hypothetical protein